MARIRRRKNLRFRIVRSWLGQKSTKNNKCFFSAVVTPNQHPTDFLVIMTLPNYERFAGMRGLSSDTLMRCACEILSDDHDNFCISVGSSGAPTSSR